MPNITVGSEPAVIYCENNRAAAKKTSPFISIPSARQFSLFLLKTENITDLVVASIHKKHIINNCSKNYSSQSLSLSDTRYSRGDSPVVFLNQLEKYFESQKRSNCAISPILSSKLRSNSFAFLSRTSCKYL